MVIYVWLSHAEACLRASVFVFSFSISLSYHTGQLKGGRCEIQWGGYLSQDFPIIGFEACLQPIVVLWQRQGVSDFTV